MSFTLDAIKPANANWQAQKILVYSVQGLGKTTFGATFEAPIIARTEDGAGALNVPTFPQLITTFADMEAVITALHGEHLFKTLVLDSLDWLEPIVWVKQIEAMPHSEKGREVKNIEDYGFGKGYHMALDWWRYLMGGLDSLRFRKGMTVVLVAHSEVKRYDSPETDPFDRYGIKLHRGAFALWQEWADMVLFCNYKTRIHSADVGFNKEIKRGEGSGERVIYTEERPAYLAKNRWGLPPEIYIGQDKTWAAFHRELSKATGGRYAVPECVKNTSTTSQKGAEKEKDK
ncbi:ATP-binding protein [Desulfuromonas thiophila]|uniref:AAA domain-containing protein n=1 Tax=Desulfuromonas thiophila TaxID=57664 RepID=A0A1G7B5L8_9BACT|nr:ATP-binding protein [Desulfuromonas thiophila]SDE21535.1 AAA domain-containing protein [Desulfuromonas thiophila]